jgi:N-acetylglucosamine-6-phosphate deacetylase
MELQGRRYDNGDPVCVTIAGERIVSLEPARPRSDVADWPYLAPGLFDIQINGHGGIWFGEAGITAHRVIAALEPHSRHGITRLCPCLCTNSYEVLAAGFAAIREACEREVWVDRMIPGCHLEGPYISAEDGPRGAHPIQHVRPADWDEFCRLQDCSGHRIRLVTVAPEVAGAIEFIRKAVASDVAVGIGHTGAAPHQIQAAVDAGASLSIHLGNGAHAVLPRHPNYIWEQLAEDRLAASIITDGHHLPPSVVRTIVRAKSPARTIISCDAAGLAGCPPGRYRFHGGDVDILADGRLVLAGQQRFLVGSSLKTDTCVANVLKFADVSLGEAMDMAGRNPARVLGVEQIALQPGSRADLILFHDRRPEGRLDIVTTMAAGTLRFVHPATG